MATKTLIGIPTYDGRVHMKTLMAVLNSTTKRENIAVSSIGSSLLAKCFNQLWCQALNLKRTQGLTHFAMVHADIDPQEGWLDRMHSIMKETSADVLSCVIAMKAAGGFTSTAEETDDEFKPRNYNFSECTNVTWTSPGLLVNTGLMLCDLRKPWADSVVFAMRDEIRVTENGERYAVCASEDWEFSRQAKKYGAKLFATTAISVNHYGYAMYPNRGII